MLSSIRSDGHTESIVFKGESDTTRKAGGLDL